MFRYLLLFTLINALIFSSLYFFYDSKVKQTVQADQELISVTFGAAVRQHHTLAKSYYDQKINTVRVQRLMWKANYVTGKDLDRLRKTLYSWFKDDYQFRSSRFGFTQMHFHLADNISFLRFHRPSAYGDDLTQVRKSVVFVNREHKAVSTFEEGKIFNGFRFIFPLNYHGQHVGSVEISVPVDTLTSVFFSHLKAPAVFLVKRKLIDEKAFASEHKNYRISGISKQYYEEAQQPIELSQDLQTLIEHDHSSQKMLNKRLNEGQFFTVSSWLNDQFYLVNFFPIFNTLAKTHSGYIVIAREHKEFTPLRNFLFSIAVVLNILIISLYSIFRKYKRTVRKLNLKSELLDELQTVARIGVWEYHAQNKSLYWSPQIYEIVDGDHTIPPDKNYFFRFVHPADIGRVEQELQTALKEKNHFTIHHRILRPDGKIRFVVDHGHIQRDHFGQISKAVGLMQDITEQKEANERLNRFINSQKDLTVLINGNSIEFANDAFLEFLGLNSLEHYHEKHNCLCHLFISKPGFFSVDATSTQNSHWLIEFQKLPKAKQLVLMKDQHNALHAFATTISSFNQEKVVISFNDITSTIEEKSLLEDQVIHDTLTRAYSRSYLDQYLIKVKNEISSTQGFYLMVLDIDYFKNVNDEHGHLAGDRLLQELTSLIQKNIRHDDKLIRWGGEEFLLVGETKVDVDLSSFAHHLREQIEHHVFQGPQQHITCSFGLTLFNHEESFEDTLERADKALYDAKASGRNTVCFRPSSSQQESLF